jgi:hypothetical protein
MSSRRWILALFREGDWSCDHALALTCAVAYSALEQSFTGESAADRQGLGKSQKILAFQPTVK